MSDPFLTPWNVAHPNPRSIEFPRLEYWSRLQFPSPGNLLDPGLETWPPGLQVDSLPMSHLGSPVRSNGRHKRLPVKVDNKSKHLIYVEVSK